MPTNDADDHNDIAAEPNTLQVANEALRHGFTIIPNYVLRANNLSRDAKLLYGILLSYAWQKGSCFPGYETLQKDMSCGSAQISRYIKELKDCGWLHVTRRGQGRTNIYILKDPIKDTLSFQNERTRTIKSKEPEPTKSKEEEYSWNNTQIETNTDNSILRNTSKSKSKKSDQNDPNDITLDQEPTQNPGLKPISQVLTGKRSASRSKVYDQDKQVILEYIEDFGREFGDQAKLASSVTRADNLLKQSGLSLEDFIARMYEARAVTKERSAAIRATTKDPQKPFPTKNKMAYFFACLEERLGLREPGRGGPSK